MRARLALLLMAGSLIFSSDAVAAELEELYRSSRMMAMGGTAVALAENEDALWLNPAGLADVTRSRFQPVSVEVHAGAQLIDEYLAGNLNLNTSDITGTLNYLMGKKITARAQGTSTFVSNSWGLGILADQQVGLMLNNPVMPSVDYLYKTTYGIQAGGAFSLLGRSRRGSRTRLARDIRIGGSIKYLYRRGGQMAIPTDELFDITQESLLAMPGATGSLVAFDLGAQGVMPISKTLLVHGGLVYTNLGGPGFSVDGPDPLTGNLAAGVAFRTWVKQISMSLAMEMRHLLADADWRKKTHVGLGIDLPSGMGFWFGLNQTQLTYGAGVDFWLARLSVSSYGVDLGGYAFENTERRWVLRADVKLNF